MFGFLQQPSTKFLQPFGSDYVYQCAEIEHSRDGLYELALGGTAVGTGLNAPPGSRERRRQDRRADRPAVRDRAEQVRGAGLARRDGARPAPALRGLAVALMKIANDMRWLASGPRCGLGELMLPENEPGSSIMPGKVNPTQCEAMVMVCIQVIGDDTAVAFAGSQGNFELNAMRPIIINNFLHSAAHPRRRLREVPAVLGRGHASSTARRSTSYVGNSLMLVTALSPVIGYQNAAHIAEQATADGTTLEQRQR